jgi:ribosome-binding protein aMBF1 (putative translation factor)
MTLADALAIIGWSNRDLAYRLECDEGTVRRWHRTEPPEPVARWVRVLARAHLRNPVPAWR